MLVGMRALLIGLVLLAAAGGIGIATVTMLPSSDSTPLQPITVQTPVQEPPGPPAPRSDLQRPESGAPLPPRPDAPVPATPSPPPPPAISMHPQPPGVPAPPPPIWDDDDDDDHDDDDDDDD